MNSTAPARCSSEFDAGAAERGDEHSRMWCALQLTETEGSAGNLRLALRACG